MAILNAPSVNRGLELLRTTISSRAVDAISPARLRGEAGAEKQRRQPASLDPAHRIYGKKPVRFYLAHKCVDISLTAAGGIHLIVCRMLRKVNIDDR